MREDASNPLNHGPPKIGITLGDPLGIGPEIVAKAIHQLGDRSPAQLRVYGSWELLLDAARVIGLDATRFDRDSAMPSRAGGPPSGVILVHDAHEWTSGVPGLGRSRTSTADGGRASFAWIERAIADAQRPTDDPRHLHAIVTAPISKTSWNMAGITEYPGHTELLGSRFGREGKPHGMLFVGPHLRVMLATIHIPLVRVASMLTTRRVLEAIKLAHQSCLDLGAVRRETGRPRLAVCGVNPHAGEGGILGEEDDRIILPAVRQACDAGMEVVGPMPGDTVFRAAAAAPFGKGEYDCVVAMYHDQGLIPIKLIDGERAINVTVGLPTIRTSPAHGTAFDIAGTNSASAASMVAAIELAADMARRLRTSA